ncbi:hypothetical protein SprV_0100321200 [Sparganum proliferum]
MTVFETANRERSWKIMREFGCPERISQLVRQLNDGMMALIFPAMLIGAYCDERPGIRIAYRVDGHLLNQRRIHVQSRLFTTTLHELLFTDDCALNATSEGDMRRSMDLFAVACGNFCLIINTEKTVVMHQRPPDAAYNTAEINVNGVQLQVVDNFTYMSGPLSNNTKIDDEVARRISKVRQALSCLRNTIWNRHGLYLNTRLKMYKAVILRTLLYGADTWTV